MSRDLHDLLAATAVAPRTPVDPAALVAAGRRRRGRRRSLAVVATTGVLVAVVVAGAVALPRGGGVPDIAETPPPSPAVTTSPRPSAAPAWWCPEGGAAAVHTAAAPLTLVSARLTTVGAVREWQSQPIGDPDDDVPDILPGPQSWLEPRAADEPAVVCVFHADEAILDPGGPYSYASVVVVGQGLAHPYASYLERPAPWEFGPADGLPLHARPTDVDAWPGDAPVPVPDVVGLGSADARLRLGEAGLAVIELRKVTSDPAQVGVVLAQSPTSGLRRWTADATHRSTVLVQVGVAIGSDDPGS